MFLLSATCFAAISLLSSLASTSPTRIAKKSPYLEYRPRSHHSKRDAGNIGNIRQADLPTCDTDPSYSAGKSRFNDGDGFSQTSGCDNGKDGNQHCWTDTFVVFWEYETQNWTPTGMAIDCDSAPTCSQENVNLNQTCTENKITEESNVKGTFELKMPEWFEGWKPGFNWLDSYTENGLVSTKICTQTSAQGQCEWDDQNCHGVWVAQRNRRVWGYQRRTCTTSRGGTNMPNTAPRPDGLFTVGMQDFNILVPDSTIIGCAAPCDATVYPGGPPPTEPGTAIAVASP